MQASVGDSYAVALDILSGGLGLFFDLISALPSEDLREAAYAYHAGPGQAQLELDARSRACVETEHL